MKYLTKALGAVLSLALSASCAIAGGIPQVPVSPNWSDPAGIINTLNNWALQFNGLPNTMFSTQTIVSFGNFCTASGSTPQTCNAQRGLVTTNSLSTAAATNANFVINDSLVTAASVCQVTVASYSGTLVTNGYPQPLVVVTGAGTITVSLTNTHAANALAGTVGLAFNCVQ